MELTRNFRNRVGLAAALFVGVAGAAQATSISVRYGFTASDFRGFGSPTFAVDEDVIGEIAVTFTPLQDLGLLNGQNPFTFDGIDLTVGGKTYQIDELATVTGVRNGRLDGNSATGVAGGDFSANFLFTGENCFQSPAGSGSCSADDFILGFTDFGVRGPSSPPNVPQFVIPQFSFSTPNARFSAMSVEIERLSATIDGVPVVSTAPMAAVPLPASGALLALGLAGLGALRPYSSRHQTSGKNPSQSP